MMTVRVLKVLILILVVGVSLFVLKFPTKPLEGSSSIEIISNPYSIARKSHFVQSSEAIEELQMACGWVWVNVLATGSNEGEPSWILDVKFVDGTGASIYVDENEFNGSYYKANELINVLLKKYG